MPAAHDEGAAAATSGDAAAAAAGSKRAAAEPNGAEPAAKRHQQQEASAGVDEVALRLLVSEDQAASLPLEAAAAGSTATAALCASVPTCPERVVVVYSPAGPAPGAAPACAALKRLAAALAEAAGSSGDQRLRLLVSRGQAGSLLASNRAAAASVERACGGRAKLEVHPVDASPLCACAGDRVAELSCSGADALARGTAALAAHLGRNPAREPPTGVSRALAALIRERGGVVPDDLQEEQQQQQQQQQQQPPDDEDDAAALATLSE